MSPSRTELPSARLDSPLERLRGLGQSLWLDYLRRDFLLQGGLRALVERDGIRGINTTPHTFLQAIGWTGQYDTALAEWVRRGETDPVRLYEHLAFSDVQAACDQLRDVYERSDRRDGFVSITLPARFARDSAAALREAERIQALVDRPNVMLSVLPTAEGLVVLSELVAAGRHVGAAAVADLERYDAVVEAYFAGLERRGGELSGIGSLAALAVHGLDEAVERRLVVAGGEIGLRSRFGGSVGVATARLAYQRWKKLHSGRRWTALAARGARPQRLMFAASASTATAADALEQVAALVGRDTVGALSVATLDALRSRGRIEGLGLEQAPQAAATLLSAVRAAGVDLEAVSRELLERELARGMADFLALCVALERKRDEVLLGLPPLNPPRA